MTSEERRGVYVKLVPGKTTVVEYVDVPADKVAAIFHFKEEHFPWLKKLIIDGRQLIADDYRSAHPRALLLPITYVVVDELLPRGLRDRINLAGAIVIDRPRWEAELSALYSVLALPI